VSGGFGRLLRDHRTYSALTQHQLADLSTLSVRAIRDLERGRALRPRTNTVRLLADGLELRGSMRTAFEAAARDGDQAGRWLAEELGCTAPPVPMNALLGREAEARMLADLLLVDRHRVVTVTGLAGVGKTRLAMEVAARVAESGAARVLWRRCDRDAPGPELARIAELSGGRDVLLVLDGVAFGAPVGPPVLDLLRRCPRTRVLVTSEAPLGHGEERVVPLAPLPVPAVGSEDLHSVGRSPSVRLLLRHIRALNPTFRLDGSTVDVVAEVCRRCDGHPWVLEQAGIWCALWSPRQVHTALERDRISLPRRIAALGVALRRGVELLGTRERRLLELVLPLGSAWTVDEAGALAGDDPVETAAAVHDLLLRGLVRGTDRAGGTRFEVLNLVRCWGADQLVPVSGMTR
jgi:transcriptional regulator with XRE-family HTH domain